MRKLFTLVALLSTFCVTAQQGPGLIVSEILPNPPGTDSPFELIELVATRTIDFSVTPYTIIAANNGNATTQGWIAGSALGYGFQISSGIVNAGNVVYVGGTSMATSGVIVRAINTGTTPGDGFGTANSSGVVGNGGTNADAIGVFNLPAASITNTTVPVDAVFYGSAIGSALVNAGIDGYQMPINDMYHGGKLQSTDILAPDPGSAQYIVASGTFNPATGAWTTARTWTLTTTFTDMTTGIILGSSSSSTVAMTGTHIFANENAGSVSITVTVTGPNNGQVVFTLGGLPFSTATGADYIAPTYVVPAGGSGAQVVTIPIIDDATAEKDEYIAVTFTSKYNCTASATAVYYIYIKDNDTPAPVATNELFLDSLSTWQNGAAGTNSAEIVAHDPSTQRLYIANSIAGKLDILNFANPTNPTLITSINMMPTYGNINSVAVNDSVVACAIENGTNPQDSGKIVFFDYNGVFIKSVKVGAMPDMITFNHAGTKVITVCEGEPNNAYTNDPDGSVNIVDISGGVANVTQANVAWITFTAYNGQEASLRSMGIRIYGVSGTASKDFEPEYATISDNDSICWVTLQENNALVKIDMMTNTITSLVPLGYKNYMTGNNALDASDQTTGIALMQAPVYGMYQPDALSHFTVGNQMYLITANEGDSRAYTGLNEESRIGSMSLDPIAFPYATQMKQNVFLGRLNATNKLGDTDNDGDFDQLYVYGGRSISIWNGTTGAQVYDSGDQLERITSTHPVYSNLFNMSNGTGAGVVKNRSDDKGPEPEGTAVGDINGSQYAFIAIERIGGVMMFNVTNPLAPSYTGYYNHRTPTGGPDRGAEGIIYIPDSLSPNGNAIVIAANEVSSTLSIFQVTTCAMKAGVAVTPSSFDGCSGGNVTLTANSVAGTTYQWMMNGTAIPGATSSTYVATATGDYQVMIVNTANACSGKTDFVNVNFHAAPTVAANTSAPAVCAGSSATLSGSGAATYNWMPGSLSGTSVVVSPSAPTTYTVTGTSSFGCTNTQTVAVSVNALPTVSSSASSTVICTGNSTSLTGSGATTFNWMPGSLSGSSVSVSPVTNTTYTVTGTDGNGCTNTSTVAVTVNTTPTVTASSSPPAICNGSSATLTGGGASTFNWMPGSLSGTSVVVSPVSNTTYTVTGMSAAGCSATQTVSVAVNALPTVSTSASLSSICNGSSTSLTGSGASTYGWMPGSLNGTTVSVSPVSNQTYTVTGTDANGCTNTSTVAITVLARPTVTASSPVTQVCNGHTTTLNSNGASTYNWQPLNVNGSSVTATINTTTIYTVTGTAVNGCTNTATISIAMLPTPTVTASSNVGGVCSGNSVTLMATGVNAVNYIWFPGMLSGQNTTTIPTATTTYTVNGFATNGCSSSSTVSITVNPSPVLTSGGSVSICEGSSSTLTVSGANTYSWMPGSLSGNSIVVQPSGTTTYTITGTGSNGCMDSANVTLTVNTNPMASLSVSNDSVCNVDAVVMLNGSPTGGTYYGNNVAGSSFDPTTAPIGTTPISYIYIDGNGCSDTVGGSINVDVCLGISDAVVSNVSAYPNPFSDQLTISSSSAVERVDIYDAAGKLLFTAQEQSDKVELDMTGFESGVYFVHVTDAEGTSVITAVRM